MPAETPASEATVMAEVDMTIGQRRRLKVSAPAGPTPVVDLLPMAQELAGAVGRAAVEDVLESGETISCTKGCGACCRQLVPISQVEARRIRDVVEALPEPRRSQVRERFAQARRRLAEAGLLEQLLRASSGTPSKSSASAWTTFARASLAPFSKTNRAPYTPIGPSPAVNIWSPRRPSTCAQPTREAVRTARIPLKVWPALARFDKPATERFCAGCR